MATWDISVPSGSGVGGSGSNTSAITPPGDFDGATINSVTLLATPTITGNENSNDDFNIRWHIETSGGTAVYGGTGADADSIVYHTQGDFSTTPANLSTGGAPTPAPTTAVAADWDQVNWVWVYTVSGKDDASTVSWDAFTIQVDYTPATEDITIPGTELLPYELDLLGKQPSVEQLFVREPGRGELDLLGKQPSVEQLFVREPARVELDLAGKVPVAGVSYTVDPAKAFLNLVARRGLWLDGSTPTIVVTSGTDHTRTWSDASDLTLAGKVPSVEQTFVREPAKVDLDLAGKQPSVEQLFVREPAKVDLDLVGKVPSVEQLFVREPAKVDLDLAGKQPEVLSTRTVSPGKVDLDLVGKVPSVEQLFVREPAKVDLDLAGKQPEVLSTRTVSPGKVDLDFAGKVPSVEQLFVREPAKVDLDLAGKAPSVEQLFVREPAKVDLDLAGKQPAVFSLLTFIPDRAELTLAGKVPSVEQLFVREPAKVDLDLAGKVPTAEQDFVRAPTEGDLTLAGKVPTLLQSLSVSPAKAFLNLVARRGLWLDGSTPTISISASGSHTRTWSSASDLTLAGKQPSVEQLFVREPAKVDLDLAGKQPEVLITRIAAPAKTDLTLAGKIPDLVVSLSAEPAIGTLALAGKTPAPLSSVEATPAVGSLALAGQTPTVGDSSPAIEVAVGGLTFVGKVPAVLTAPPIVIPVPEYTVTLDGKLPTRAVGLLLYGYEPIPNQSGTTGPIKQPAARALSLETAAPNVVNTTPNPRQPFTQLMGLEGYNPPLEISQNTSESSLGLVGKLPVTRVTSPQFFVGAYNLALSGKVPTFDAGGTGRVIPVDEGTLALAGKVPVLQVSNLHIAAPAETDLTLAGEVPELSSPQSRRLFPAAAALTINEQPLYTGRSLSVPAKGITLNGKLPLVGDFIRPVRFPAKVDLTLAGYAPVATNIGYNIAVPAAGLTLNTGLWENVRELPFYDLPILANNTAIVDGVPLPDGRLAAAYYSVPMDSPDHYAEMEIVDWNSTDDQASLPWLWVRAANTAAGGSGYYTYLYVLQGTLYVDHYRWDAPTTYVFLGSVNTGLSSVVPDGSILRLEVSGTTLTTSLDTGGGLQVLRSITIGPEYANQTGVGFGMDEFPAPELAVDSFRAGPSPAILDDFNRTTINLNPIVNQEFVRIPGDGSLVLASTTPSTGVTVIEFPLAGALILEGQLPRYKIKKRKRDGARTRLISLSTDHNVKLMYD